MTATPTSPQQLTCPQCQKVVLWTTDYPYRPFCSERCRLIDLGEWANESYRVPVEPYSQDE